MPYDLLMFLTGFVGLLLGGMSGVVYALRRDRRRVR